MKDILIRPAITSDVETIYDIMHTAQKAMADPSAYITDDISYIAHHVEKDGFGLMAEINGSAGGFFIVCVPGLDENNLGHYLGFSEKQLMETALMDSAAVLPEYQGMGVMGKLFQEAVRLSEGAYPYLLGTVHPDNLASRRNFEKNGFTPLMTVVKPGGQVRLLMGKFRETPEWNK